MKQSPPERTLKDYLGLVLRGFCMGASDIVPGVSGGTIAFIFGIYEELVDSIRAINLPVIKLLLAFKLKTVFKTVPWQFLLAILIGILLAVFSLSRGLEWLLDNHPVLIWSFFSGLVLSSSITVSKRIGEWNAGTIITTAICLILSYFIVGLVPVATPETWWFIFLSGTIVICAMILPGISGSFILVLLGKYQYILEAVNRRDILTLGIFATGAAVGIITFAQVVSWLFKRYHDLTVAALMGLMIGSLRKIWPWQETISWTIDRHGAQVPLEQINILPPDFGSEFVAAIGIALVGFLIVVVLDILANKEES